MKKSILVLIAALTLHSLSASASLKEMAAQKNAEMDQVVLQINDLNAQLKQTENEKTRQHLKVLLNERLQKLHSLMME